MMDHQKSGCTLSFFKKLLHNERGQEVGQNHITSFFQKSLFHGKWAILSHMCHNSGSALKICFKIFAQTGQEVKRYIYTLKDAKRYMKVMNATQCIYICSCLF